MEPCQGSHTFDCSASASRGVGNVGLAEGHRVAGMGRLPICLWTFTRKSGVDFRAANPTRHGRAYFLGMCSST